MDFATLKAKVADWLNRVDLNDRVGDFINIALRKIERGDPIEAGGVVITPLNGYNCMRTEVSGTLTAGDPYLPLPVRYKETINFWIVDNGKRYPLEKNSKSYIIALYGDLTANTGRPVIYGTDPANSRFILRPTPDTDYTYYLEYYKYSPELVNDTDTNWWTENAWEILLYGALIQAEPFMTNDTRIATWAEMLKNALNGLAMAENRELFNGSPQNIRGNVIV